LRWKTLDARTSAIGSEDLRWVSGHPSLHQVSRAFEFSRNPLESQRRDPPIFTACNPRFLLDSRLEPFCTALRSQMNEPEYASMAAVRNGRNTCVT
jgi:hypothetical protein